MLIQIQLHPMRFLGQQDESNFYGWLESIPGFTKIEGYGEEEYACFDPAATTEYGFLEMVRLFIRYRIDRNRLVSLLVHLPEPIQRDYLTPDTDGYDVLFN